MNAPIKSPPELKSILYGLGIVLLAGIQLYLVSKLSIILYWIIIIILEGNEIAHA